MVFFVLAFVAAGAFGLWYAFKPQLLQGLIWVRQGEMALASLWTENDYMIEVTAGGKTGTLSFGDARVMIGELTPEALLSGELNMGEVVNAVTRAALMPLRIPIGIVMGLIIFWCMFRGPTSLFRTRFNLDGLIEIQSRTFAVVRPLVKFNPLKLPHRPPGTPVPAELPLFAEALSPEEWVAFNKVPMPDGDLDRDAAEKAFTKQLAEPWKGAMALPPYLQILLATFCLKAVRKRAEADDILGRIAACWDPKKGLVLSSDRGLLSEARKILKNKDIAGETLSRCNRHAFVSTALLRALDTARSEGGVLAPAQFIWLRGHDRRLWYPLNNLGRQAFHIEALGAMSHYRAEKQVNRPIPKPRMQDAVTSLSGYLANPVLAQPIPQLDFSMVRNRKEPDKNKGILKPAGT